MRIAALNHKPWHDPVKNGVAIVKAGAGQAGENIHRARRDLIEEHEEHIANVRDRDDASAKGGRECARGIGRSGLHNREFPERIIGLDLRRDAVGAADGSESERTAVG